MEPVEQQLVQAGPSATIELLYRLDDRHEIDRRLDDLIEFARSRALTDTPVATVALDVCREVGPRLQRPDLRPHADYIQARIHLAAGQPDAALTLIERARAGWLAIDRPLEAYRTDLGRMNVLDDLGRHLEAVDVGERLLDELTRLDPSDPQAEDQVGWLRAAAQENLGAAYGYTGRHREAMAAYEEAEAVYAEVGGSADVARCLANRGVEQVALGYALEGHGNLSSAAATFDVDDPYSYAKCLGHMADAELLLGWFTDCLDHITEARTILADLDAATESVRLALIACRAYLSLNLWAEAIDVGEEAERQLSTLGLRHDLAEAQFLLATAYTATHEYERAFEKLDTAIAGADASDDVPLRLRALTLRSANLAATGAVDDAESSARQAVEIAGRGRWPAEEWAARLQLSRLVDGWEADEHLASAAALAAELDLPHLRYGVLLEVGRRARSNGRLDQARELFGQAIALVEDLRSHIGDSAARISFLEGRTAGYEELLATLLAEDVEQNKVAAFELAERSRARTLTDMMTGNLVQRPGDVCSGSDADSNDRGAATGEGSVVELEADLAACYGALLGAGGGLDRERRLMVQQRAVQLERALQRRRLEAGGTDRTMLHPTPGAPDIDLPTADEQVIEYHVSNDRLLAFVWSDGELDVVSTLPSPAETRRLVDAWVRNCERYRLAATLPADAGTALSGAATKALEEIGAQLFAPVAEHLRVGGELLVLPSGPLHAVPFHAVPFNAVPSHAVPSQDLPVTDGRVGEIWTVVLAPSYSAARRLQTRRSSSEPSLVVGVADEAVPAVDTEATAVAATLSNAELLVGESATLDAVGKALGRPRDVVHFACHGMHRSRNPMFSSLQLSDGWLTAHDVMSLDLDGSLVVLSACETGRHERDRLVAEPLGLAHSFLAVGARAVVVSLWKADDAATAELMSSFYRHSASGLTPAAALQKAQADVVLRHPHPAAWASFAIHSGLSTKGNI